MNKLRHYRNTLLLPALAIVCTGATVCAQEYAPGPDALPVILDHKQAAGLIVTQPPPEYPPVAKVNYLQGQVQLELTVNGQGKVVNAHVVNGIAILAAAALQATHQWIYHPLNTAAGPSGFITTVRLKFTLRCASTALTPRRAEQDFVRQVKPLHMERPPEDAHPDEVVHMRLLIDDQGKVIDREAFPAGRRQFEAASETLRGWTFHPAQWGNLPIASYLDVDVPVSASAVTRTAAISESR